MRDLFAPILIPIHREGWPFIAAFALATVLLWLLWAPLAIFGGVLTLWCTFFFRDPARVTPTRPGLVISPADGVVQSIAEAVPPPELGVGPEPRTRVSVFMNIFNVHVNRIPVEGVVRRLAYRPGKFFNAAFDKASADNERQAIAIELPDGRDIVVVQIAGLVARRIVCGLEVDEEVRAGARFGMIRFGSRLDIYLPPSVAPLVCVGQNAVAGETVLADLNSDEGARSGVSN